MKKIGILSAALALCLGLSACSSTASQPSTQPSAAPQDQGEPVDVVVFAAASMEASLTEIADQYKEVEPNVNLVFTFDSSGTLKDQIQEGAVCDLFISAAPKQMNQLDAADTSGQNEDGLDFVNHDTRVDLLENKVVLAVPDSNPADIQSFQDLASDKLSLLCLGNDSVPVGAYSLDILASLNIDLAALEDAGKVTYASNVSEVATQVKEGAVDCGIIYATDANTYELTVVDQATEDLCGQVIYPAAVMKCGTEAGMAAAQDFLDYLRTSDDAHAVLEGVGFTVLS
ncbi:molybdate ABC transporter substrate-binding protein [Pseudoflavonifractor phocaeensis]|uniref:molybdate ABC transporter substrate-binding protein n=1 Tax=Pseudoflavonifractor phocaeensis TaxID=1870988 RepID=UPI00195DE751|nr:molybdate ABC transporter substrate-binding protein [Pseudoflavonifractor phocaeensis]MBM6939454.1 molybdate ABC transporter substrate-binding protein [Pseudoflavonifractor phocaeensis]